MLPRTYTAVSSLARVIRATLVGMVFFGVRLERAALDRRASSTQRGSCVALRVGVLLGGLSYSAHGLAQPPGPSLCVPGTSVCASADGHGGVQVTGNGNANAQVTPNGASASGQANANGSGNANGGGMATANGGGQGTGSPPPQYYGGGSGYRGYEGRYGFAVGFCPIVRVGVWSGFKAGGCFTISFRFEGLTFEMETQLLYGGSTHAFDWTFPISFVIPLANEHSLFEGGYLRFGGSPIGATFAHARDGGSFVRFGLFAGAGYELEISRALTWRVIDARLSFDMATKRAMDREGHWVDLGLQLGSGIIF